MLKSLPASISRAVVSGVGKHAEAQAAADHLAAIMTAIHGGEWHVSINHPRMVAMIWQVSDRSVEDRG